MIAITSAENGMGSQAVSVCDSSTKMKITKGRFYCLPVPVVAPAEATGTVKLLDGNKRYVKCT